MGKKEENEIDTSSICKEVLSERAHKQLLTVKKNVHLTFAQQHKGYLRSFSFSFQSNGLGLLIQEQWIKIVLLLLGLLILIIRIINCFICFCLFGILLHTNKTCSQSSLYALGGRGTPKHFLQEPITSPRMSDPPC